MSGTALIGTRKGLFELQRGNGGDWSVIPRGFSGDPVTIALPDQNSGSWYAGLNLGHFGVKLHRSADRGKFWQELSVPSFPAKPAEAETTDSVPWTVLQLWALEAGGADRPGTLWAGTIPGGLFFSFDEGSSWQLNESLWSRPERKEWFGGGYDHPGIHSICVDPRDSQIVSVGVSCGGLWRSADGGDS